MRVLLAVLVTVLCACSDDSGGPDLLARDSGRDGPRADGRLADGAGAREGSTTLDHGTSPTIWHPAPGTTWQWQLKGTLDTSVNVAMYDIDLFTTSDATIKALRQAGRVVICYFSAGSYEPGRPDSASFPGSVLGNELDGWPDERWLDVRSTVVRDLMRKRIELARTKGCDGVEPDNVDGYLNDNGFSLKAADQLSFNTFLATEAHARGLSVGLKNDLAQVPELVQLFDWALNEQCHEFDECDTESPFITAGKAVFHVEYTPQSDVESVCPDMKKYGFSTLIKHLELDAWYQTCP